MTDIYLTVSLSTHNGDVTPQNYESVCFNSWPVVVTSIDDCKYTCTNVWVIIVIIKVHIYIKIYLYHKTTYINFYLCFAARGIVFLRDVISPAVL